MSDDRHFGEELQDLLDGRLAEPARADLEAHLARCPRCREELAVLEWARAAARGLAPMVQPAELPDRIARALNGETHASGLGRVRRDSPRRWPLVASGLVAAATLVVLVILRSGAAGAADLPATVARDFDRFRDARLALELRTPDPAALERFFAQRGIAFRTRVFDLAMMRYRLIGGRVHRLAGRPSALFAYAGAGAARLICEMFEGTLAELPGAPEQRLHDGITFRIYRVRGVTLVFWQEGAVVCVLASDGGTEETVRLAYAKAVKV